MSNNTPSSQGKPASLIGFASAGIACFIPRLHDVILGRKAAILVPVACGSLAWYSWKYLLTKPLESRDLVCSPCACIRGTTIAVFSGCILPSFVLAFVMFNRRNLFRVYNSTSVKTFFKEFSKPYNNDRPYILGLWAAQGTLGFGVASWEFSETYLKTPPPWCCLPALNLDCSRGIPVLPIFKGRNVFWTLFSSKVVNLDINDLNNFSNHFISTLICTIFFTCIIL